MPELIDIAAQSEEWAGRMANISIDKLDEQRWITAIHEAGHVLGASLAGAEVTEATIVPSRRFEGQVRSLMLGWDVEVINYLLGHAAELEFGYQQECGHKSDYSKAEKLVKEKVMIEKSKAWSEKTGIKSQFRNTTETILSAWDVPGGGYQDEKGKFVSYRKEWKKAVRVMKSDWKPEFDKYVRKARRLAKKHRAYIEKVARLLVEKSTLTNAEIPQLEKVQ